MRSKVEFLKKLPNAAKLSEYLEVRPEKYLVICDRHIERIPQAKKWLDEFEHVYSVRAGEELKDFSGLADHVKKIFRMVSPFSVKGLCVIAVGGGTVGDFAGFVASILKRGVPLIHVPTTLLAAMDSAHGGKTALNLREFKNQIGTFYPAKCVFIVRSLFEALPPEQMRSAVGELAKMAFIEGGSLFDLLKSKFKLNLDFIWDVLPEVIEAKYRWVEKDPFENSGDRQVLNLGHSLGHALEAHFELPHGIAVAEGLNFTLRWSQHMGYLPASIESEGLDLLENTLGFLTPEDFATIHGQFSRKRIRRLVSEDKKGIDSRHFHFVFLEGIGAPFRKKVAIDSFVTETIRQGWAIE